jgi:(2R)-ethylmalonyl-CoA mutase
LAYMKQQMVGANAKRFAAIESGEVKLIGVNSFQETAESPLTADSQGGILKIDEKAVEEKIAALQEFRKKRSQKEWSRALQELKQCAKDGKNLMEASIASAKAGVTTGEWGSALREVFGEYRAPTGVSGVSGFASQASFELAKKKVAEFAKITGEKLKILVGKPGLDGHSNGAEQIAVRARDAGMEVVYPGIRLTPQQIAESALQEDVHLVGLSILSGSHLALTAEVVKLLRENGVQIPVIVGGIIPPADQRLLIENGIARVYTPKDFELNEIMQEMAEVALNFWRETHR